MTTHCLLCGSDVVDERSYAANLSQYRRLTRYQGIVDVLIDSGRYDAVFFDHDTELPSPYRSIARLVRNALQEEPGKGRHLHKKWPDVVGVKGETCDIVIEEERQPGSGKAEQDIARITRCKYLWVDSRQFSLAEPYLFILLDGSATGQVNQVLENVGTFKRVVICDKAAFDEMYRKVYLLSAA